MEWRLRNKCCHYANIMSYNDVSKLLKEETGVSLLAINVFMALFRMKLPK